MAVEIRRPGRFAEGQKNRQKLLDYLNAHPWASTGDCARHVAKATGVKFSGNLASSINLRLHRMQEYGEVERKESRGSHGKQWIWRALCAGTRSAAAISETAYAEESRRPARNENVTVVRGAHTIHRGTERSTPLANQRGQGAVRAARRDQLRDRVLNPCQTPARTQCKHPSPTRSPWPT